MPKRHDVRCVRVSDDVVLLERPGNLLYGLRADGLGTVLLRIVTVDEETGRVEFLMSIDEAEDD